MAHPASPDKPFFRAVLRPSKLTPFALPLHTSWMDLSVTRLMTSNFLAELTQPPIPPAEAIVSAEEKAKGMGEELDWLVGSEGRLKVKPEATGYARVSKICAEKGTEEEWGGFGDGVGFPKFAPVAGRGVEFTEFSMTFPEPRTA